MRIKYLRLIGDVDARGFDSIYLPLHLALTFNTAYDHSFRDYTETRACLYGLSKAQGRRDAENYETKRIKTRSEQKKMCQIGFCLVISSQIDNKEAGYCYRYLLKIMCCAEQCRPNVTGDNTLFDLLF